ELEPLNSNGHHKSPLKDVLKGSEPHLYNVHLGALSRRLALPFSPMPLPDVSAEV
ncbi:hypothetical protein KUCAC02_027065, partial [Chaenocephalus aceratus]